MPRKFPTKLLDLSLFALLAAGCAEDGEPAPEGDELEIADELDEADEAQDFELVEVDGVAAVAPRPGTSVWSETLYADGTTHQFMLHTTHEGEVVFEEVSDRFGAAHDLADVPDAPEPALDPCHDDAYVLSGWHWESTLNWYFHAGSIPGELGADATEAAMKAGTNSVLTSTNSCGLSDEVSATHHYLGRKATFANINTAGNCLSSDGTSAVSFGDLPTGVLATTCVWFSSGVAKESDVQFNKADYTWTTNPGAASCSKQWSVKTVMTHERGHTFGLGHVGEGTHGNLTMSPTLNGPCQDSEVTLGQGDVLGLRAMY